MYSPLVILPFVMVISLLRLGLPVHVKVFLDRNGPLTPPLRRVLCLIGLYQKKVPIRLQLSEDIGL
jgi:hypothetical protein